MNVIHQDTSNYQLTTAETEMKMYLKTYKFPISKIWRHILLPVVNVMNIIILLYILIIKQLSPMVAFLYLHFLKGTHWWYKRSVEGIQLHITQWSPHDNVWPNVISFFSVLIRCVNLNEIFKNSYNLTFNHYNNDTLIFFCKNIGVKKMLK